MKQFLIFIGTFLVGSLLALMAVSTLQPRSEAPEQAMAYDIRPDDTFESGPVPLRGALWLPHQGAEGLNLRELSDLAWDEAGQRLFAVSDQGILHHIKLTFIKDWLAGAKVERSYRLRRADGGAAYSGAMADAEGLALWRHPDSGHQELLVAFEGHPRISRFTPDGEHLGDLTLPPGLADKDSYQDLNSALEALAVHPRLGILTAAERPRRGEDASLHMLSSLDGARLRLARANGSDCALVGLESSLQGDIILLERCYQSMSGRLVVHLRQASPSGQRPEPRTLATWDTAQGWQIDNFEGITRVHGDHYLLVSDDNAAADQRSLLLYVNLGPALESTH